MGLINKRILIFGFIAILVACVYLFGGRNPAQTGGVQSADAGGASTGGGAPLAPGEVDPNAVVTDPEQNLVMQAIQYTPDLSEVYIDKTVDGKLVVSVTADLSAPDNQDIKTSANKVIAAFIANAYKLQPLIAGCMINVVEDNHLIAGAELGITEESSFAKTTSAGVDNPNELILYLQEKGMQTQDVEQSAWYYFTGPT
ncbi:MAG: hypothetical protein JWN30_2282 [Bacilli bacterium]|nr:hypothetical protein [Bacilli bacterium]